MILTHGVSYLSDVAPQSVFQAHLQTLAGGGYESVHSELARLLEKNWYSVTALRRADGKLDFPCQPLRFIAHRAVPRARDPSRWRRVVDSWQPRRARVTRGAQLPVVSLAAGCGWDESKLIRRAAVGPSQAWIRHTPAFRRPTPRAATDDPVASSKTPTEIRAMVAVGQLTVAEGTAQLALPRHPPQYMPIFTDFLLAMCLVGYLGHILNEPLVSFGDDEADCFHQFALAYKQLSMCGIAMLDPYELLRAGSRRLAS
jgi:hypothetical protein